MSTFKQFQRSESKIKQGVWVGKGIFDPNPDGSQPEVLLRPAHKSNDKYNQACLEWRRKNPRMYRGRSDLQTEIEKMQRYALERACVYSWRNFQEDDGADIPYDHATMVGYLRKYPDFADVLIECASEQGLFLEDEIKDMKGE